MDMEDRNRVDDRDDGDWPEEDFRPGDCVDLEATEITSWEALGQALDHAYRLSGPDDGASTPALDDRGNPMTSPFHGTPAEVEANFLSRNPGAREAGTVGKPFLRLTLVCSRDVSKTKIRPFVLSSMDWAGINFGGDIVSLVLHMDGDNPHIHLISNCAIERRGSHNRCFDWPRTEFGFGESYRACMRHLRRLYFDEKNENDLGGAKMRPGVFDGWLHQDAVLNLR
jgi:hypothetical protein